MTLRKPALTLGLIVLSLVVAITAAGCGSKDKASKTELGLKDAPKSGSGSASATGSVAASAVAGSPAKVPGKVASGASNSSGSSGSGSGSSGSGSGSSSQSSSGNKKPGTKPVPPASGFALKILWWNDTQSKAPANFEVVYGSSSYKPTVANKSASGTLGPIPTGKAVNLVIYPDGRNGKRITVPIQISASMSSGSEVDAVHVAVSDSQVRVLGNPVDNFDRSYDRF